MDVHPFWIPSLKSTQPGEFITFFIPCLPPFYLCRVCGFSSLFIVYRSCCCCRSCCWVEWMVTHSTGYAREQKKNELTAAARDLFVCWFRLKCILFNHIIAIFTQFIHEVTDTAETDRQRLNSNGSNSSSGRCPVDHQQMRRGRRAIMIGITRWVFY